MGGHPIYLIGQGQRSLSEFIFYLKKFQIDFLIDLRFHPFFSNEESLSSQKIQHSLEQKNLKYISWGEEFQNYWNDHSLSSSSFSITENKIGFRKKFLDFYSEQIKKKKLPQLQLAWSKNYRIMIMTDREFPLDCPLLEKITFELNNRHIPFVQIDQMGQLFSYREILERIECRQLELFERPLVI